MIRIHDKAIRGRTRTGWLDSYHTFSFGAFSDPARMGFGNLRVINDDAIIPGSGFAPHEHDNMDILTFVTAGRLRHEDDQGHVATISEGEIQAMSAGSGLSHSEMNASEDETARFLQIWLIPDEMDGVPSYAQALVPSVGDVLLAGPERLDPLVPLRSASTVTLRRFEEGQRLDLPAETGTDRFVHLLDGLAFAETERVSAGDGLEIPSGDATELRWASAGAALVFKMPRPTASRPH